MKKKVSLLLGVLVILLGGMLYWNIVANRAPDEVFPVYTYEQEGVVAYKDIEYKQTKQHNCKMDVACRPDGTKKPLLVVVHGGMWIEGSRASFDDYLYSFSALDYVVANIDYDLVRVSPRGNTEVTIMDQERDIAAAISYLVNHAERYEIDTNNIFVVGHSAGGQLAGNLVERVTASPEAFNYSIRGLILMSAATDFRYFLYDYETGDENSIPLVMMNEIFDGDASSDVITEIEKVDVLSNLSQDMPSTLIIHGDYDQTVSYMMSKRLCNAMEAMGCDAQLEIIHGMEHNPETEDVGALIYRFVQQKAVAVEEEK